ncbi:conserved hypothetical protein [Ricinus communis]|uniref:Uncharacterized protein n=1 Tax=Ricinus communis TaxID=3988 RepID=B9T4U7_RICCO|nr:conserved hypothetical protein [Ricinus communis]
MSVRWDSKNNPSPARWGREGLALACGIESKPEAAEVVANLWVYGLGLIYMGWA